MSKCQDLTLEEEGLGCPQLPLPMPGPITLPLHTGGQYAVLPLHLLLSSARCGRRFHRKSLVEEEPLKSPVGGYSKVVGRTEMTVIARDVSALEIEKAWARADSLSGCPVSEAETVKSRRSGKEAVTQGDMEIQRSLGRDNGWGRLEGDVL